MWGRVGRGAGGGGGGGGGGGLHLSCPATPSAIATNVVIVQPSLLFVMMAERAFLLKTQAQKLVWLHY